MSVLLETERLLVRPLEAEDGEALYAVLSDPEVMRYVDVPYSRAQTADFIRRVRAAKAMPVFAVVWKESGTVIGHLIYHPFDRESWELGWILRRDCWGKGIADELTAAALEDARRRGILQLAIECAPEQRASRHLAEKHGFGFSCEKDGLAVYRKRLEG